jgi:hypothetical protein
MPYDCNLILIINDVQIYLRLVLNFPEFINIIIRICNI